MKRLLFVFVLLTAVLCGCAALYRFPEGAVIGGVDVAGLDLEAAAEKLEALPEAYTLTVTLDGETTVLTGADLSMTCHLPEDLRSAIGTKAEDIYDITLPSDILTRLHGVDTSRKDGTEKAKLVFDPTAQSYITQTGKDWTWNDYSPAVQALSAAARELKSEVTVAPEKIAVSGEKDPLPGAATANTWLDSVLTLSFPDGEEKVDRTNILEWVSVDSDGVTPVLDESAIGAYAANMAQAHSVAASDARVFVTTSGKNIYLQNAYGGYSVNAESLTEALRTGILSGEKKTIEADILPGNALPIANIPLGTLIHCIEMLPGKGAQLVRSAGNAAQLMAKEGAWAQVRLPSGEVRMIPMGCKATIGQVGNIDHENVNYGKAGRVRHMGFRPHNRGVVMNPNDHPHGGGEGKSPVGMPGPVTPWGKPTQGRKTRKHRNPSDKFIVKRRNGK